MKENTSELTNFLLETLKQSKDFVVEKAPQVAQEMLTYGLFDNAVGILVGIALAALVLWFAKRKSKLDRHDHDAHFGYFILIGMLSVFSIFMILGCVSEIVKIKVAPSVYLIEKISKGK